MTQGQSQVIALNDGSVSDFGELRPGKAPKGLLSTHEFALICYTSVRTLQFYDKKGLLKPAHVDRFSGYRYYKPEQARDFFKIKLLQSFRIELVNVPRALKQFDEQAFMQQRLDIVRREIEEKQKEYRLLKTIQEDLFGTKMEQHIKEKETGPVHFLGMQVEIRYDAIGVHLEELEKKAKELGIPITQDQITLYLDPLHYRPNGSLMEIGWVIKKIPKGVELPQNLFFKTLPKRKSLVYTYNGPYTYLTFAHKNMVDISAKKGFKGLPFEIYKGPFPKASVFDLTTVVCYPVEWV